MTTLPADPARRQTEAFRILRPLAQPDAVNQHLTRLWKRLGPELVCLRETRVEVQGFLLVLRVEHANLVRLKHCEQEILDITTDLIQTKGRRVTAKEIKAEMRRRGREWGNTTLHNALAQLVAFGRLMNPHDKRGYGIAPAGATESVPVAS